MHRPEKWSYVQFTTAKPGTGRFRPDPTHPARELLMRVYHAQRDFQRREKRWAAALAALSLPPLTDPSLAGPVTLRTTEEGFQATAVLRGAKPRRLHVRQDSRLWEE